VVGDDHCLRHGRGNTEPRQKATGTVRGQRLDGPCT
jgi:hypothetical protein